MYHQIFNVETDDPVSVPDFSLEELTSQPVALVKAAAEQTTRALPESGTRAISSLWGKFSQLPVIQNVAAELKGNIQVFKMLVCYKKKLSANAQFSQSFFII